MLRIVAPDIYIQYQFNFKLLCIILPGPHDIFAIENPDKNKNPKNNIKVGDIHQPLKKTHLLLRRSKPV
ncbi:MAG TPA: hypothetical protein PKK68_13050, partial [Methanothrix soehngenii]|nr:hypothetical protein [Methanothrix soehngenii]